MSELIIPIIIAIAVSLAILFAIIRSAVKAAIKETFNNAKIKQDEKGNFILELTTSKEKTTK